MSLITRRWKVKKRREAGRRNQLGVQAMSREEIDQANNVLQTVLHQLAGAQATRDLAKLDLERTAIRARRQTAGLPT